MSDLPSLLRSVDFNSDPEWLADRKNRFGASESASFFKRAFESRWPPRRSAAEVIAGKLSDEPDEAVDALKRRESMEPGVLREYVRERSKTEQNVHVQQDMLRTIRFLATKPFVSATCDAFSFDRVVELKTAAFTPEQWEEKGVPISYQIQVQQQMLCTGLRHADLAVLFFGANQLDFRIYPFEADDEFHGTLIERLTTAWEIVEARRRGEDVPLPDAGPNDGKLLARWCPPIPSKVVQMASVDLALANEMFEAREKHRSYGKVAEGFEEIAKSAQAKLVARMNGAELATFTDSSLRIVSKLKKRAAFDVAATSWVELKEGKE